MYIVSASFVSSFKQCFDRQYAPLRYYVNIDYISTLEEQSTGLLVCMG